jgi:acetylornithine/LysW-gamma-L-lysine aminotransferase
VAQTNTFIDIEKSFSFEVYPKRDITLVRGLGAKVWDEDGKEYIDCVSGHGVSNLGHKNPAVAEAVKQQVDTLITCPNVFYNDKRALLLEKLIDITPSNLGRAFLCNSGAESVEAAIKFARFTTEKTDFVCAMRAFHGRTFGALSATFKRDYRDAFEPLVPGFSFAPFNNFEKLKEKVTDRTAGILLEVVQGEGGVHIGRKEYFERVRKLCDERGMLLILDEIQSGFCRTGKMFAVEHVDIEPDMLLLAKAIAGGLPMGAVVCSNEVEAPIGKHGTTFGGNPLVCAAARAAIDFMIENRLDVQAEEKGRHFRERLSRHKLCRVREVRNLGLMIGIELREKAVPLILDLLEKGLLVFPAGSTVIRVYPPLTIEYPELDFVIDRLVEVLK